MNKLVQKSTSRKQLLQNTINHFNSSNRAIENNSCQYLTDDGKRCAIGRELPDSITSDPDYVGVSVYSLTDILPMRLQKMGMDFLREVQSLHDRTEYWYEKGLSKSGKRYVERICKRFNIKGIKYPDHLS